MEGFLEGADQRGEVGLGYVIPFHQHEVLAFLKFDCLRFGGGALHGIERAGAVLVPAKLHVRIARTGVLSIPALGRLSRKILV